MPWVQSVVTMVLRLLMVSTCRNVLLSLQLGLSLYTFNTSLVVMFS